MTNQPTKNNTVSKYISTFETYVTVLFPALLSAPRYRKVLVRIVAVIGNRFRNAKQMSNFVSSLLEESYEWGNSLANANKDLTKIVRLRFIQGVTRSFFDISRDVVRGCEIDFPQISWNLSSMMRIPLCNLGFAYQ